MGMNTRLDILAQKSSKSVINRLETEYLRLVSPDEMGQVYKMMYIGKEANGDVFPFISETDKLVFW